MCELNKESLLAKGNELIEKINGAIGTVETIDIAKGKVVKSEADVCINIRIDADHCDCYQLKNVMDEKSCEKVKAFIMTELDMIQEQALKILYAAGIDVNKHEETVEKEYEESGDSGEYMIADEEPLIPVVEAPNEEADQIVEEIKRELKIEEQKPKTGQYGDKIDDKVLLAFHDAGKTLQEMADITGWARSSIGKHLQVIKAEKECARGNRNRRCG